MSDVASRIDDEITDSFDEELEMELDDDRLNHLLDIETADLGQQEHDRRFYFKELFRLQYELIRLQDWVVNQKLKVVVLFEGRDAAGKGGVIKRITQRLNPRVCRRRGHFRHRTNASAPNGISSAMRPICPQPERSCSSIAVGTIVPGSSASWDSARRTTWKSSSIRYRSSRKCWFDRASILIKYWFSITDDEQHLRFQMRIQDPIKQWKLSPMDLESRRRWEQYTKAKEIMLERTYPGGAVVDRRGRGQEESAAELHPPSS